MARARTKFQYQDNDPGEKVSGGQFDQIISDGFKVYSMRDGKNRIRILPRTWSTGPKTWSIPAFLHYQVGPDKQKYLCRQKHGVGDCPICDERQRLASDGESADADALRPGVTRIAWVIDRMDEDAGPKIMLMPAKKLAQAIVDLSRDEGGGLLKIDHPDEGYDVTFECEKSGGGGYPGYSAVQIARKSTYLSEDEDEQEEWLKFTADNPPSEVLNFYDEDYIAKVFGGTKAADDDDDSPPPRTRGSRTDQASDPPSRASRSRAAADDDDEGTEEEEPPRRRTRSADAPLDEPEEEEEPPRRRRGASARTQDDDDDDDDDAPPRSRRRTRAD